MDFYVKWRIENLRRFYEANGRIEESATEQANDRLGEIIKNNIKSLVTQRTLQQVVNAARAEFTDGVLKDTGAAAEQLGVTLVDVRITKIDLPSQVQSSVYDRMKASFKAQAAKLRAEGQEASVRIKADADKQQTEFARPRHGRRRRSAAKAMRRRVRFMPSRIRRTPSSTASTRACRRIAHRSARRAICS